MSNAAPLSLFDRFDLAIHGLKRSVADAFPLRTMPGMLIHLIYNRFARLNFEVQKLAAEIRAGKIRPELASRTRAARERAEPPDPATAPKLRIPQDFGWLIKRIPHVAAGHAEYFRKLLSEPEMVEMISVSGRMRGLLRPLCRALMIEPSYLEPRILPVAVGEERPVPASPVAPSCSSCGMRPGGGGSDCTDAAPEPGDHETELPRASHLPQEEPGRTANGSPSISDWEDWGSLGNYNSLDVPPSRIAVFHGRGSPAADPRPDEPSAGPRSAGPPSAEPPSAEPPSGKNFEPA